MKNNQENIAVCFTADFRYLYKNFSRIYSQLLNQGKYSGEVLVITSTFCPTFLIPEIRNSKVVTVLRFPKIKLDKDAEKSLKSLSSKPNRHTTKRFQWQKLNLFKPEIKKWTHIFYIDINMTIHHDINSILDKKPNNKIYARSDGYPNYIRKLETQFDTTKKKYLELKNNYDLSITNYFQTGVLYFDTSIIKEDTFHELIALTNKYPISITNEQGILNIFFIFIDQKYNELPVKIGDKISYFYWNSLENNTIITKSLKEQYK